MELFNNLALGFGVAFTLQNLLYAFIGCVLGITLLAAALSKFFLVEMSRPEQALCLLAALLMIAPGLMPTVIGAALAVPMLLRQLAAHRRLRATAAPTPPPPPSAA